MGAQIREWPSITVGHCRSADCPPRIVAFLQEAFGDAVHIQPIASFRRRRFSVRFHRQRRPAWSRRCHRFAGGSPIDMFLDNARSRLASPRDPRFPTLGPPRLAALPRPRRVKLRSIRRLVEGAHGGQHRVHDPPVRAPATSCIGAGPTVDGTANSKLVSLLDWHVSGSTAGANVRRGPRRCFWQAPDDAGRRRIAFPIGDAGRGRLLIRTGSQNVIIGRGDRRQARAQRRP
jgi:hypothetical protein